jgi:hypothetical protein
MAPPAQIAANQLNSRKSTGPTTPEGRAKSSMNALKRGNRSRKVALLREESHAFEERLRKWMAIGDAHNDVEEYLIYRNVCLSFGPIVPVWSGAQASSRSRTKRNPPELRRSGGSYSSIPPGPPHCMGTRRFLAPGRRHLGTERPSIPTTQERW